VIEMPRTAKARIAALESIAKPSQRTVRVVTRQGSHVGGVKVAAMGKRYGTSCVTDGAGSCTLNLMLGRVEELEVLLSGLTCSLRL